MKLLRKKIEKRNLKLRQRNLKLRGERRGVSRWCGGVLREPRRGPGCAAATAGQAALFRRRCGSAVAPAAPCAGRDWKAGLGSAPATRVAPAFPSPYIVRAGGLLDPSPGPQHWSRLNQPFPPHRSFSDYIATFRPTSSPAPFPVRQHVGLSALHAPTFHIV